MTLIKKEPVIYTNDKETKALEKFASAFQSQDKKKLIRKMNEQDEAIVSFELFSKHVRKLAGANSKLKDDEIDCAYVYLCRGMKGPFSKAKVEGFSAYEMAEKVQGFDSQNTNILFEGAAVNNDIEEEYSEDSYSQASFKEESIEDDAAMGKKRSPQQSPKNETIGSYKNGSRQETDGYSEENFVEEDIADE